ncbi:MAG: hypothetical protein BGP11_06180 [Rhodobacterales bacterium 65-51]|uniref:hypothetical protein n=1 Tax=uncultured Gemmobacter sp. TaxID=1095917 RepID=UPI00095F1B13|nr:hypothetical protein [uncultured Gemmobacter sp.]OJY25371.1 MAG: hypothetical protein BGP11_06180 [Rhodobacterales bacterium 65-51]
MPNERDDQIAAACTAAHASDADTRFNLMQALCLRAAFGPGFDIPEVTEPVTVAEASDFTTSHLGVVDVRQLHSLRDTCWLRLIAARTPEQRLSLERLINAFGVAIGMTRHEEAAQIIQNNCAAREATRRQAEKDRALDRWRGFGVAVSASART